MDTETRPTDTFRNAPNGEVETNHGKFRYSVGPTEAHFSLDERMLVVNRVEYSFRATLKLDESGHWALKEFSMRRKDYGYPSDSAREKAKTEIIPHFIKWLNGNPEILKEARRAYLANGVESIKRNVEELQEHVNERRDDASYIERCLYDFNEGLSLDWIDMDNIIRVKNRYIR